LREKATAGPKDSTFSGAWRHGSHLGHFTAASAFLLSLSCSLFLVEEAHLWGSCHSPGTSTPSFGPVLPWPCAPFGVSDRHGFSSILSQPSSLLHGMGVRGGLGVNAFRQLHLNIKSNLPSPFCSSALAERDELCQCAPGEGKGADEAHRVTWEQAGMVQGTDLRMTCTFSQDPGQERGQLHLASRATHVSAFDQAKQAGLHVANVPCSNVLARSVVRLLDHVWRPPRNVCAAAMHLPARRSRSSPAPYYQSPPQPSPTVMKSAV